MSSYEEIHRNNTGSNNGLFNPSAILYPRRPYRGRDWRSGRRGHNSGRKTAEGAGIGAGVGLLAGALVHNHREATGYYSSPRYTHSYEPS